METRKKTEQRKKQAPNKGQKNAYKMNGWLFFRFYWFPFAIVGFSNGTLFIEDGKKVTVANVNITCVYTS